MNVLMTPPAGCVSPQLLFADMSKGRLVDRHLSHQAVSESFSKDATWHVSVGLTALSCVLVAMFRAERSLKEDVRQLMSHSRPHAA